MLTDRQQKFFDRISVLSKNVSISQREVKLLSKCRDSIVGGKNFKSEINELCLKLREVDKFSPLSLETEKLYHDLTLTYGEVQYPLNFKMYQEEAENDWKKSDPDFVYGRSWDKKPAFTILKPSIRSQISSFLETIFIFSFLICYLLAFMFPWVRGFLGDSLFFIIMGILFLLFMSGLILGGRLKRDKKKHK